MRVFINNRDLLTWPRRMAEHLLAQGHEVVILDNDSSYGPLLEWYNKIDRPFVKVIRLGRNLGPASLWVSGVAAQQTEPFCYTDPDLDITTIPDDWPEVLAAGAEASGEKCGFSLLDDMVPSANPAWLLDGFNRYPRGQHPAQWGERIRVRIKGQEYFQYPIDTTFALYYPGQDHRINGLRAGVPYTAMHLPWHVVLDEELESNRPTIQIPLDDELVYYYTHASKASTTASRLRTMLWRYQNRKVVT